jgi:hypothetical protein
MADTLYLMGDEMANSLIPKGIVKETEAKVKYLVIDYEN